MRLFLALVILFLVGCNRGELCSDCVIGGVKDKVADVATVEKEDPKDYFIDTVHPQLRSDCMMCHSRSSGTLYIQDDAEADYQMAKGLIVSGSPEQSKLYNAAQGVGHMGGKVWEPSSSEISELKKWIEFEK